MRLERVSGLLGMDLPKARVVALRFSGRGKPEPVGSNELKVLTTQETYEASCRSRFDHLDDFEAELSDGRRYLLGDRLTESDLRLFVSLIRFDVAYGPVMYLTLRRISDYPGLTGYLRRVRDHPQVAETVFFDHYRCHYFDDDMFVNRTVLPDGRFIVPLGSDPA